MVIRPRSARSRVLALAAVALTAACIDSHPVFFKARDGAAPKDSGVGDTAAEGNDGAADAMTLAPCMAIPVVRDLITDFSDAHPAMLGNLTDIEFDVQPGMVGGTFTYPQGGGLPPPSLSMEPRGADQALRVMAKPGKPINSQAAGLGVGIGWGATDGQCLDATGYSGVRFTIQGTLGTCQLLVGVNFSRDLDARLNAAGTCLSGSPCYGPATGILTPNTGTLEARFADMTGGSPVNRVDVTTLSGVIWALLAPLDGSCDASFTIDDVRFFR